MRKRASAIAFTVISFALSLILVSQAEAGDWPVDQSQQTGGACITAYAGYNRNQTFTPTVNIITQIDVKMNNRNGGNVDLALIDNVTGQIVALASQRMGLGDGWETFNLVDDTLGYVVDTDHQHSIWIGTGYYSGDTPPCWYYSSTDVYDGGVRRNGLTEATGDLQFVTYGFSIEMGRENPETPDVPAEDPVDEPVDDTTDDTAEDSQPVESPQQGDDGVTIVPDEPVEDDDSENIEESADVAAPELDKVIVDKQLVEVEDDIVIAIGGESLQITGMATPGDEVSLYIGDDKYVATADEDGNWYVVFELSEYTESSYEITAKSSDGEKASEKVSLFTLVLADADTSTVDADKSTEETMWQRLTTGDLAWVSILSFALLFIVFLIILIVIKSKEEKEQKGESKVGESPKSTKEMKKDSKSVETEEK